MADSADTANQLTALDKQLTDAQAALATARTKLVQAIDAELAAGTVDPRASELGALRSHLKAQLRPPKKIVIPNTEIDPLADQRTSTPRPPSYVRASKS
jgi:recombinational DNA repair ATPase RecF